MGPACNRYRGVRVSRTALTAWEAGSGPRRGLARDRMSPRASAPTTTHASAQDAG